MPPLRSGKSAAELGLAEVESWPVDVLADYAHLVELLAVASQMLKARARAGLTQDAVAERMGTTKSAISRLESAGKHAPSLATLKRYANAVGCELKVRLVPHKAS